MAFRKIKRGKKPTWQKDLALERIRTLFLEAEKAEPNLAKRYVKIARDIGKKLNLPIPAPYNRKFCKACGAYLIFGRNARQRIDSGRHQVIITCLECKNIRRMPYIREIKEKRKEKSKKQDL